MLPEPEKIKTCQQAPGVNLEMDILRLMDFKPIMKDVRMMPQEIFREVWGLLAENISPTQGNSSKNST